MRIVKRYEAPNSHLIEMAEYESSSAKSGYFYFVSERNMLSTKQKTRVYKTLNSAEDRYSELLRKYK